MANRPHYRLTRVPLKTTTYTPVERKHIGFVRTPRRACEEPRSIAHGQRGAEDPRAPPLRRGRVGGREVGWPVQRRSEGARGSSAPRCPSTGAPNSSPADQKCS